MEFSSPYKPNVLQSSTFVRSNMNTIMRKSLVSILFCFTIASLSAQVEILGGARVDIFPDFTKTETMSRTSFVFLDTTRYISQVRNITNFDTVKLEPKLSGQLGLRLPIKKGNGWSLKSGLDLLYSRYEINARTFTTFGDVISSDTVSSTNFNFVIGSPLCDRYVNAFGDLNSQAKKTSQEILLMRIPLVLQFEDLLGDEFDLMVGAYLQTPLYTSYSSNSILLESENVNGENVCTWHFAENDHSGKNIRNSQFGASIGLSYEITERLDLILRAEKTFSNILSASPDFKYRGSSFRPMSMQVMVKYQLSTGEALDLRN